MTREDRRQVEENTRRREVCTVLYLAVLNSGMISKKKDFLSDSCKKHALLTR